MEALSDDLLLRITSFLSLWERARRVQFVSKRFNALALKEVKELVVDPLEAVPGVSPAYLRLAQEAEKMEKKAKKTEGASSGVSKFFLVNKLGDLPLVKATFLPPLLLLPHDIISEIYLYNIIIKS